MILHGRPYTAGNGTCPHPGVPGRGSHGSAIRAGCRAAVVLLSLLLNQAAPASGSGALVPRGGGRRRAHLSAPLRVLASDGRACNSP